MPDMKRFLTHFLVVTLGLAVAVKIVPGGEVDSLVTLLVAALVLGFINAVIRPVLTLLTLPITCLTLGLFYLVVNGLAFTLAAFVVPGFHVASFGWAVLGALVVSVVSWFIGLFGEDH